MSYHYRSCLPCAMNTHAVVDIGEPAASSLSSCLRSFPGGFSLLTETGLLHPYLLATDVAAPVAATATDRDDAATPTAASRAHIVKVTAAPPLEVSNPLPQGVFPVDRDIPVDHTWSRDGVLLIVLRRTNFSVYCVQHHHGQVPPCPSSVNRLDGSSGRDGGRKKEEANDTPSTAAVGGKYSCPASLTACAERGSLVLVKVHSVQNNFEGKTVACCRVPSSGAAMGGGSSRRLKSNGRGSPLTGNGDDDLGGLYLVAVGGSFGIECHSFEATRWQSRTACSTGNKGVAAEKQRRRHTTPVRLFPDDACSPFERCKGMEQGPTNADTRSQSNNMHPDDTGTVHTVTPRATTPATTTTTETREPSASWTCRQLPPLFEGFPVVAVDFSQDSNLLAAAAMTGHVRVWEVSGLLGPPPATLPPPSPLVTTPPTYGSGSRQAYPCGSAARDSGGGSVGGSGGGSGGRGKRRQWRKQGQVSQAERKRQAAAASSKSHVAGSAGGGGPTSGGRGSPSRDVISSEALWGTAVRTSIEEVFFLE